MVMLLWINETDSSFPLLMSHTTEIWLYKEQMASEKHNRAVRNQTAPLTSFLENLHPHEPQSLQGLTLTKVLRIEDRKRLDQRNHRHSFQEFYEAQKHQDISVGSGKSRRNVRNFTPSKHFDRLLICTANVSDWSLSEQNIKLIVLWPPTDLIVGHKSRPLREV